MRLRNTRRVETIAAESLLLSNAELAEKGMLHRKGQPETYNTVLASGLLQRARWGAVKVPGYSFATDDIEMSRSRTIDRPDILLIDGFNCVTERRQSVASALDLLLYVEAPGQGLDDHQLAARDRADIVLASNLNGFYIPAESDFQ